VSGRSATIGVTNPTRITERSAEVAARVPFGDKEVEMSEQEKKLRETYETLKKKGLIDIKFSFAPLQERTKEQVCESVNDALQAIIGGKVEDFPA